MVKKELLIIIPAFNEENNIVRVFEQLEKLDIPSMADILVIDDASTDQTDERVRERRYGLITHIYNLGYGSALQSGYKYAVRGNYKYVIQMDADGQHDACNIPVLYRELKGGDSEKADIVLGSRFMAGSPEFPVSLLKRLAYAMFRFLIRHMTGRHIADPTTGLQGLSREAFLFYSEYNHFDDKYPDANMLMQMLLLGYCVKEIPAVMHIRDTGKSMHSGLRPAWYMLRMLFSMLAVVFRVKILRLDVAKSCKDSRKKVKTG
ncbi:hypothetical protein C818_00107 [Lachnospiraceae bacterium MD308]|nr:hypothetical protein C818_00107 [Lachnospiraceae bacterium MD308]